MKQIEKRPGCVQQTLKIMGDRWSALILVQLNMSEATFSELERSLKGISPRTLSQRLTMLENEQIIYKLLYCQHPPRYRYTLTKKGEELQIVLKKMSEWGAKYWGE